MKNDSKKYSLALYELTKGKNKSEIDGIILDFYKVLAKNNQLKLKKEIIEKFSEIYNRENGIVEAEITSREKLDEKVLTRVRTWVHSKYGAKEVSLKEKTDESIRGGIVLQVGDEMIDASVSWQLKNLRNTLLR